MEIIREKIKEEIIKEKINEEIKSSITLFWRQPYYKRENWMYRTFAFYNKELIKQGNIFLIVNHIHQRYTKHILLVHHFLKMNSIPFYLVLRSWLLLETAIHFLQILGSVNVACCSPSFIYQLNANMRWANLCEKDTLNPLGPSPMVNTQHLF